MSVALKLLIQKTEAALAAATEPLKKARLERDLAAYKFTSLRAESDGDEGDDEDEDDDEDDAAGKAAKRAEMSKKKAEAAKHKAMGDEHRRKAAECDEKARKAMGSEDDDEDEEAKALRASLAAPVVADTSSAAAAALAAQAEMSEGALARVAALEAKAAKREQDASIKEALADGRITPHEAKMLAGKSPEWCGEYIATRKGVRVVATADGHLVSPRDQADADANAPAQAELAEINHRIAQMGVTDPKRVESLRAEMIANRRKAMNGAQERF